MSYYKYKCEELNIELQDKFNTILKLENLVKQLKQENEELREAVNTLTTGLNIRQQKLEKIKDYSITQVENYRHNGASDWKKIIQIIEGEENE